MQFDDSFARDARVLVQAIDVLRDQRAGELASKHLGHSPVTAVGFGITEFVNCLEFATPGFTAHFRRGKKIGKLYRLMFAPEPTRAAKIRNTGFGTDPSTSENCSLLAGFNPGQHARLLRGLGGESAGLLVVGLGWFLLTAALSANQPNLLALLGAAYLFVLTHYLAGWLLFRHRLALDLETERSPEQANAAHWAAKGEVFRAMLMDLHRLCSTDRVDEAFAQLATYIDANEGLDEASVYLALKDFHDPRLRLEHSYHYIGRLVRNRDRHGAWQVLRDAVLEDSSFRPPSDEILISLLDEALHNHAPQVEALLADFNQRFPDSHLEANALFRLARVRIDHLGGRAEGLALLDRVASEHPEFAGQQRFRDYRSRQDNAAT